MNAILKVRDETDTFWYVLKGAPNALLDGSAHTDTRKVAPTAGDLVYANASDKWDALPIGAEGEVLKVVSGAPAWVELIVLGYDTKANILALTPDEGLFYFATDTYEIYFADGAAWYKSPFALVEEPQAPDMGYTQDSSRIGYGLDYLTDKLIANSRIGSNSKTDLADGDVRVTGGVAQIYLNGEWQDVVTGLRLREDDSGNLIFEHKPTGLTEWLEVNSGNSNTLGLNGLPLIQQYGASMGAYPVPLEVDGGTF